MRRREQLLRARLRLGLVVARVPGDRRAREATARRRDDLALAVDEAADPLDLGLPFSRHLRHHLHSTVCGGQRPLAHPTPHGARESRPRAGRASARASSIFAARGPARAASSAPGCRSACRRSGSARTRSRRSVLPALPEGWGNPDQVLLRALRDARTGCTVVERSTRCVEDRARPSEEPTRFDRVVTLQSPAAYVAALTALPRPGADLLARLQQDLPINVTGSSTGVPDSPRLRPGSDGRRPDRTTWTPSSTDARPQLSLNWIGTRAIRGLRVRVERGAPVRRPMVLQLTWPGGTKTVALGKDGRASFAPIRTDSLAVRVTGARNAFSIDQDGVRSQMPVGIGEIRLRGLPLAPIRLSHDVRTGGAAPGRRWSSTTSRCVRGCGRARPSSSRCSPFPPSCAETHRWGSAAGRTRSPFRAATWSYRRRCSWAVDSGGCPSGRPRRRRPARSSGESSRCRGRGSS